MNDATGIAAFEDAVGCILHYHQRTKHHLHQYARSAGYLDWANQPDPFRTFAGAPRIDLPLGDVATPYDDLYRPGAVPSRPLDLGRLGIFFELALGLSAWKHYQNSRWALRCNPSSGNLHPTEGYAILLALPGVEAGVYHYFYCPRLSVAVMRVHTIRSEMRPHAATDSPQLAGNLVKLMNLRRPCVGWGRIFNFVSGEPRNSLVFKCFH